MEKSRFHLNEQGIYEIRGEFSLDIKVAISGSFKRHLEELGRAIDDFSFLGANVLSSKDNKIVDEFNEFAFLDSDLRRSIKGTQSRHFAAIANADLLYVVCPDGYTGQSVCAEIGCAINAETPILASALPTNEMIREYVTIASPTQAVNYLKLRKLKEGIDMGLILLEPEQTITNLHNLIEEIYKSIMTNKQPQTDDPAAKLIKTAQQLLRYPGN